VNREGWESYARTWDEIKGRAEIPDLSSDRVSDVEHLGDEWSLMKDDTFSYGVDVQTVKEFGEYLDVRLFAPHLPDKNLRIMEIGPGGGRVTKLLLPRASELYAVDISEAMLQRLQARFAEERKIVPIVVDGTNIRGIAPGSLDAAISFDAFVHFEPWEIFRYLEIIHTLLRNGGIGIIHFSDTETPIGFELFRAQVPSVVQEGVHFATFSVMSKGIMRKFLTQLGFEIVSISNDALPRDAVAVFRRKNDLHDDRRHDA
jgi:SAM-dependent methyltransferase